MTNRTAAANPIPVADLRRTFESSVDGMNHSESPKRRVRYGVPIAVRPHPVVPGGPRPQDRALSDAARALALLWKLPVVVR
jgi:hypothetical protein